MFLMECVFLQPMSLSLVGFFSNESRLDKKELAGLS